MIKTYVIIKRNGKVIRRQESHTFNRNFMKMLVRHIYYCDLKGIYEDGEEKYMYYATVRGKIAIGSGSGTVTFDDYQLFNKEMDKNIELWEILEVNDTLNVYFSATFVIDHDFSITEVGLFGKWFRGGGEHEFIMFDHTLLDSSISVVSGDVINVTYQIQVTKSRNMR